MKLVVDSYEIPGIVISKQIFKCSNITELKDINDITEIKDTVYCVHEESCDLRKIKYYFNEIVEIKNNLVYYNKRKKVIKYYNIILNNEGYIFKEIKQQIGNKVFINKNEYLPHLKVQENEVVIFPNEDEEEEEI